MKTIELPAVDFDGIRVQANHGYYLCPFRCGRQDYPARKWKTENGFRMHMTECPRRPSLIQKQNAEREERKSKDLSLVTRKIGDRIFFVREIVVKPTHEQRFNRMVRVRYEPVKRFEAGEAIIETINWDGSVYFNAGIRPADLCATAQDAHNEAIHRQESWDEHVRFSASCR